jgi:exodeoxyribonuclease V beta subunit
MLVPFQAYEASAGSGKTFSLVVRYLGLLFLGEDPEQILALTFTNKAANEMQERIIETLMALEERGELGEICKVTGLAREAILAARPDILKRFLNAETKVMTLDSFFAKILRKFSLHAGLMPNFTTFEAQHEIKVTGRFLNMVQVEGQEEMLIALSLLASKRLSDIFALLKEFYVKSNEIDTAQYRPVAYQQFADEAMALQRQLRERVESTEMSAGAKKTMQVDSIEALMEKSWIVKESLEYWQYKKGFTPQMDTLLHAIQQAVTEYMLAREQYLLSSLFTLLKTYEKAKQAVAKEDGELSFDDITALVYYLLKERVDRDFLYFRLDSRISHMLLDEFQDTSVIQFDILRPIINEMTSGEGVRSDRSFFLVGDVKQSIYRFRGGTKALFHTVTKEYGLDVHRLSTNYRSARHVVEFVNDTFADKIEGYEPQTVKDDAPEGHVEVLESDDVLQSLQIKVKQLVDAGVKSDDIAVLTQTNADGSDVEAMLRDAGIEVVTETTSKLINQPVVRALIEYLKYSYFNEKIYAHNFFALIERNPEFLERCDIHTTDIAAVLKRLIEQYDLFGGDMNLLRFLEIVNRYRDIEQFLYEYERIDAKAAQADLKGVRVLTVHKSKGLEYDHVIVMDRLGNPKNSADPIIYDYDGVKLQRVYLRMKHRAVFDTGYAKALEKEEQLSREDDLNALYVAFTRAKRTLFVIRKSEKSKFDLLELPMHSRGTLSIPPCREVAVSTPEPLVYEPQRYGRQDDEALINEEPDGATDHAAVMFGIALHYTLEMMECFSHDALHYAMGVTWSRYGAQLDEQQLASIEKRIARLLDDAQFQMLAGGSVYKEQPIGYKAQLRYLDLMVEHEDKVVVIDYKSGRNLAKETQYHEQVAFYVEALEAITGKAVEGYLCYLLEQGSELVRV